MLGRRIYGADNRMWVVGRRWLPWKPRRRGRFVEAGDAMHGIDFGVGLFDEGPWGLLMTVIVAVVFVLFLVFVFPVILTALEIVLVLVLLPLFVVARIVLRKPWIIVARTKGPPPEERTASVSGWTASSRAMDELIQEIRSRG